jgi:hypothetical protein
MDRLSCLKWRAWMIKMSNDPLKLWAEKGKVTKRKNDSKKRKITKIYGKVPKKTKSGSHSKNTRNVPLLK